MKKKRRMKKLITQKLGISYDGIILFPCKMELEGTVTFAKLDQPNHANKK